MQNLIILTLTIFLLVSCKKEEIIYPEFSVTSCDLCVWAKSVEGKYIGIADGIDTSPTGMSYYNTQYFHDSLIIDVEQIWKDEYSPKMDSTVMVFKLTYTMQSDTTKHKFREIHINTSDGKSISSNYKKYDIIGNNKISIFNSYFNHGSQIVSFIYEGIKIQ